jgi:hypothetical protein
VSRLMAERSKFGKEIILSISGQPTDFGLASIRSTPSPENYRDSDV